MLNEGSTLPLSLILPIKLDVELLVFMEGEWDMG